LSEKKTPTILIIDDEKSVLDSFKLVLEKDGLSVFTAENSENALSILKTFNIDIALIDLKLGKEDGLAIGEIIMKRSPKTKAILFTGYPSFETAIEATKRGFFYYMEKTTSTKLIKEKIREAIRSGTSSGKDHSDKKQKSCLNFITICRHSLIVEQIKMISDENICLDHSRNFSSIREIISSGFQKETDLAMVCASCIFNGMDESIRTIKEIYILFPFIKIIIINENFTAEEKAQLLKIGVKGFFRSEMDRSEIEKALLVIRDGGIWAEREILNLAIQPDISHISSVLARYDNNYELSIREKDVLKTMVLGIRNKDIADRLYISEKTVKTHINRIFKKLGVDSRVKAILKAKDENLV